MRLRIERLLELARAPLIESCLETSSATITVSLNAHVMGYEHEIMGAGCARAGSGAKHLGPKQQCAEINESGLQIRSH